MADQVDEVKSKTDIVSVIGSYIDLKKAGRNFKANCPFHGEKTPSFMVSPELQIYKCFGCGESGDVISFLEKYEGMEFYEALKLLADRAGIKLKPTGYRKSEKDKLFQINALVKKFYEYILTNHKAGKPALSYLTTQRGLTIDTIKQFGLGYSPDVAFAAKAYLVDKKKISLAELERVGLLYKTQRGYFDRFRGRVIFPLHDHRGNVCGFSGRILPSKEKLDLAKYINNPETEIYHKSNLLYGLETTRSEIKKKGEVVVVEGELDLISSYKAGVKNIVALKGSAFTPEQARLLARYAKKVILSLDADIAGDKAARRGIEIVESEGLEVSVVTLEGYKDPDDIARGNPEAYKKLLASPVGVWDFIIDSTIARYDSKSGEGKAKISKELVPVLASIRDDIVKAHYIEKVAQKLSVPADAVAAEVGKVILGKQEGKAETSVLAGKKEPERRELLERNWVSLLLLVNPKVKLKKLTVEKFETPFVKQIIREIANFVKGGKWNVSKFAKSLPDELKQGFSEIYLSSNLDEDKSDDDIQKEMALIEKELDVLEIKGNLNKIATEIKTLEKEKKTTLVAKKQREFAKLTNKLSSLGEGL